MKKTIGILVCLLLLCLCTAALADVKINKKNFPDESFRIFVQRYDTNRNDSLSEEEIKQVTSISLSSVNGASITSLSGIRFFTSLSQLSVSYLRITSLDLSGFKSLKRLNCSSLTLLKSLDVSNCRQLDYFYGYSCSALTKLNLKGCAALKTIHLSYSKLKSLDVSPCKQLTSLTCSYSDLTSLRLENLSSLSSLNCQGNTSLRTYIVKNCDALRSVSIPTGHVSSVTITDCSGLTSIYGGYSNTEVNQLNVRNCENLLYLTCGNSRLSALNMSGLKSLTQLRCENNNLTRLNVSGCPALKMLDCARNPLSDLQITGCKALEVLNAHSNKLQFLNLNPCVSLRHVDLRYNKLNLLNVSNPPILRKLVQTAQRQRKNYSDENGGPYDSFENHDLYAYLYVDTFVTVSASDFISLPIQLNDGTTIIVSDGVYAVSGDSAVFLRPVSRSVSSLTIPAKIVAAGTFYPVTEIAENACKSLKDLKSVTIGRNVRIIGESAFSGCTKLKLIDFKTSRLKERNVGFDAFRNIHQKAVVKCPADQLKAYQAFLFLRGLPDDAVFR